MNDIRLHPYQRRAVAAVHDEWQSHQSTLLVLPTGTGKTICFSRILADRREHGRGIVLAHREELIGQAVQKIQRVAGVHCDVEMADQWADGRFDSFRSPIVVSTIQTQISGRNGDGRMTRFVPSEFATVVRDEAHHCVSPSDRRVLDHYRQNPAAKILGVTATPNRADEAALGQIFESCAYSYDLVDAVRDGWLVPITQGVMPIDEVDLSQCRTTAGDLNGGDLARILEREAVALGMADAIYREAADRKTLIFCASVEQAKMIAEILNRYKPGCARAISGKTPREERRQHLLDYARREFLFLCNCAVFLEGFDDPGIEVVVPKPTKSLPLFLQMIGRGTRTLPGVLDSREWDDDQRELGMEGETECSALRRLLISESAKPQVEILDLYCQTGRHRIVSVVDALGGRYTDEEIQRVKREPPKPGQPMDVQERLELARQALAREAAEAERRKHIRGVAKYHKNQVDPFSVLDLQPSREYAWERGRRPTAKMAALLERQGFKPHELTFSQAGQIITELKRRWTEKIVTPKQAKILKRYDFPGDMKSVDAKPIIDAIFAHQFRPPAELLDGFRRKLAGESQAAPDGPPIDHAYADAVVGGEEMPF